MRDKAESWHKAETWHGKGVQKVFGIEDSWMLKITFASTGGAQR